MKRRQFLQSTTLSLSTFTVVMALVNLEATACEIKTVTNSIGVGNAPDWAFHPDPKFAGKLEYKMLWMEKALDGKPIPGGAKFTALRGHEGLVIPKHMHPEGEYIYVVNGSLSIVSHMGNPEVSETQTFSEGNLIYVPPGTYHETETVPAGGTVVFVFEPKSALYY